MRAVLVVVLDVLGEEPPELAFVPDDGAVEEFVAEGPYPSFSVRVGLLLDAGNPVIVYTGGDEDDYRHWTERHRIDLHGRSGFMQLALRQQVPVVPLVAHAATTQSSCSPGVSRWPACFVSTGCGST